MANASARQPDIRLFGDSYRDYSQYPTNLVYRASFRKVLESYKKRLDSASALLFFKEETSIDVRIRDYNGTRMSTQTMISLLF
jgi:hypothetical protein